MKCPECAGEMRFDRNLHMYVCTRCGLALTSEDRDKILLEQRSKVYSDIDSEEERKRRRKDYLKWWLSDKKE
ncbi:MAG: hypothetical protein OdinLCB4_002625 [Candidatus Odinarchaeum yellowstonii]|uniref:TFIIB-type domain-containing protein n=1 Tax=Odinarchaeota yellowstonii (strain LCB_4) TaxID=1841599 RepID=A0AAF0D357_ODILC|nr:MAG: hypothetical protein OdinLCB4_002625 [Candidatus Odinarchaeum yellowstonii]